MVKKHHPTCILDNQKVEVIRNSNNHIIAIIIDNASYRFNLDDNGNVLGYSLDYLEPLLYVNLEGTYDVNMDQMSSTLIQKQLIPSNQPYNQSPWNIFGTESIGVSSSNTVDWVLVSFRAGLTASTEVTTAAAIVLSNGKLEFSTTAFMANLTDDSYYVVIEHRNHMAVMSPTPVQVKYDRMSHDFRSENSYLAGGSGQKQMTNGKWTMFAGNGEQIADVSGYDINGLDHASWLPQNGLFNVYGLGDYNLDADVNGADRLLWNGNNGIFSKVPK